MRLAPAALICASLLSAACASSKPWRPGAFHPVAAHVVAGDEYGEWMPEPGYVWADANETSEDSQVRWAPGSPHPFHPHVVAGPQPGRWMPADGFVWSGTGDADMWLVKPAR